MFDAVWRIWNEHSEEGQAMSALARLGNPDLAAIDAINDFTRTRIRDSGFMRRIVPPIKISNGELDRSVGTNRPFWRGKWGKAAL